MNKTQFNVKMQELINELEVQEIKTDEYSDALEDIIYYLEDEIRKTKTWMEGNPELKLNLIESEGYLRGLLFVQQLIKTHDCSNKIYKEIS